MWKHVYAGICWFVGADPPGWQPEQERIMAGTSDSDQVRTVEQATLEPCDRCGAESGVVWERDGDQLWFCNHHSRANATALYSAGWRSQRVVVPA